MNAVHPNSLATYAAQQPEMSRRARSIYNWVLLHGPATDREILHGLELVDMNSVRPRITEMVHEYDAERNATGDWLAEVATTQDALTGMKVRRVKARTREERAAIVAAREAAQGQLL